MPENHREKELFDEIKSILLQSDFREYLNEENLEDNMHYLKDAPFQLYEKNGFRWLKISFTHFTGHNNLEIRYAYHGYLNKEMKLVERHYISLYPQVICHGISNLLNDRAIGEKIANLNL